MSHAVQETEIKLAARDVKQARRLLRLSGFQVFRRRVLETNTVYDTPGNTLRQSGRLLRVRRAGALATLTYKGIPLPSAKHKSREELEVSISDAPLMGAIFERLGYLAATRYEKFRTEYRQPGSRGIATIDETPVGVFIELEGSPTWIDRTARRLGFTEKDYILLSYSRLYVDWCRRQGVAPTNMVFAPDASTTGSSPLQD